MNTIRLVILLRELNMKNLSHEEQITLILIGIAIGVGIGFVLKVFVDSYIIIEGLPL
jgi:hypothetical protein